VHRAQAVILSQWTVERGTPVPVRPAGRFRDWSLRARGNPGPRSNC